MNALRLLSITSWYLNVAPGEWEYDNPGARTRHPDMLTIRGLPMKVPYPPPCKRREIEWQK